MSKIKGLFCNLGEFFKLCTCLPSLHEATTALAMAKRPSASETPTKTANKKTALAKRSKIGADKKKNASKSDANKPKKPPTAFFYFLEDFRKGFQEQNPDVKSMREVGKACGEKWRTMTYEEKVHYYDIATEKRAKFEKALADYVKKKENGKYDEFDEDSEYDG